MDIFAQRMGGTGTPQWTLDGITVCGATGDQYNPFMVSDGAGGVIIVWQDNRSGTADVYAQRVNAAGAPQWAANGVALCAAANNQYNPAITSDGSGGAIVTWADYRTGVGDIYAQRINGAGAVQWLANGVALCTNVSEQSAAVITTDGSAGAIVAWNDLRTGTTKIFGQRVNSAGANQWNVDGNQLLTTAGIQTATALLADGAGGAIVVFQDQRSGTYDIYARRWNSTGGALWPQWPNGAPICVSASDQYSPEITTDGSGGAIITWYDNRNANFDVYAQRITNGGAMQWTLDGNVIASVANAQQEVSITSDGIGGALISWQDSRVSPGVFDAYAQHINGAGLVQWAANGVPLCTAASNQTSPVVASNGATGAIAVWTDNRTNNFDLYAQRIDGTYGYWGHPEPIVISVKDVPNDQGGKVAVNWRASDRDIPVPATIDFYSVWRATEVAPLNQGAGTAAAVTTLDNVRIDTPKGTLIANPASSYYWELVGTQTAYRAPAYSYSAATRADSVLASPGNTAFMVASHAVADEHIAFFSNSLIGRSVDNLAPPAPLFLTAQRAGANVNLKWNRVRIPDLRDYSVYRQTSSGVTPVPINFLADSEDTVLVDASAPPSALYYIVTANDVHANQGPESNEAAVSAVTGVGNLPAITSLMVLQNHPNPFSGATELQVGLTASADISFEVYDVAGKRVKGEVLPGRKGWQRVRFDGRSDAGEVLANGVYFYRISANGETSSRKFVIAR